MGAGEEPDDHLVLPISPTTTLHAHGPIFLVAGAPGSSGQLEALFRQAGAGRAVPRRRGSGSGNSRRIRLQTLLLVALACVSLASLFETRLRSGLEEALALARGTRGGGAPPPPARDLDFPVQACCIGEQCVRNSRGRHAVVTHVRSQREVTQLQVSCICEGWHCKPRAVVLLPLLPLAVVVGSGGLFMQQHIAARPGPCPVLPPIAACTHCTRQ